MRRKIFLCLLAFIIFVDAGLADLSVHFLDVGQGDAALILCDGEAMLIDGGPPSASQLVYSYLREQTQAISVMIATHPHDDHIGGLAAALNAVSVDVIYSPVVSWPSKSWQSLEKYADAQGTPIVVPSEGDVFSLGGATVTVLHCWPDAWTENDMSIVVRLDYGSTSFLFTGDAEASSEYMMLDEGLEHADVLKVGHHGSRSSSTVEYIATVSPTYAEISCGAENQYGHPHEETLAALAGSTVLRTDQLGTIVLHSDGHRLTLSEGNDNTGETAAAYIGNKNSMKFHYPDCQSVADMAEHNKVPLASRDDAIALGYKPCGRCKP